MALAATTFVSALLYAVSGFGFAVLAAPLFLLLVDPAQAIQLVIILSTALSLTVLPGLRRSVAPQLLLRLTIGSIVGLPIGLVAFRYADPVLVRLMVGATILIFAALVVATRRHRGGGWASLAMRPGRDLAAGAISGAAAALVGMAGPPVLIYLLLARAAATTVRATLLAFFALSYGRHSLFTPRPSVFPALPGPPRGSLSPSRWLAALPVVRSATGLARMPLHSSPSPC